MNLPLPDFSQTVLTLGDRSFSLGAVAMMLAGLGLLIVLLVIRSNLKAAARQREAQTLADEKARKAEQSMQDLLRAQSEIQGRMATMADVFGSRQAELNQSIQTRLDGMTTRIGQTLGDQTRNTHENLSKLQERLAVIDQAQTNIQSLAGQVVALQDILSNKQTRGAFGQSRMETIVADGLSPQSYEFQATLSNGKRPDCLIKMPNDGPSLVIDAKFPMEAWSAIRAAEGESENKRAVQQFRGDIEVHLKDISEKYLISGETQDTAFMFVPSESIFAEIHEAHETIVQKAYRLRVVIVSPSLLMLSIQVVQAVLKDTRMREQAHLIQGEVMKLMLEVNRLDDRVRKLQGHFSATQKDVDQILTTTDKVMKSGTRIEALEFGDDDPEALSKAGAEEAKLNLRLVDDLK